jgi:hypothetical protein
MKQAIRVSCVVLCLAFALTPAGASCVSNAADSLVPELVAQAAGLRETVLQLALNAAECASRQGLVTRRDILSVIDYSLPSTEPRLFVFDLKARKLLFRELVAHGKNSGDANTTRFSNEPGSLATSLGLFVTTETYTGSNGYSLRLEGLEPGVNDRAAERLIVMHGAYYVSEESIRVLGRLGRSSGCPAVRAEIASEIIDVVRGGTAIFAYYPERAWLSRSAFVPHDRPASVAVAMSR